MDYIYHYTAINTLLSLLHTPTTLEKDIIEARENNPDYGYYINFHASDLRLMNDRQENKLINTMAELIPDELALANGCADWVQGKPYVVSFCKQRDFIPMWNMYADTGKGICLKFRRDGSDEDIKKINTSPFSDILLKDCTYLTEREFRKRIRVVKKELEQFKESVSGKPILPGQRSIPDFNAESAFLKLDSFKYEQEVRLAVFAAFDCRVKQGRYGISPYYPVKIPLRYLEEIIVGPSAHQDILEYSIKELLRSKDMHRLSHYGIDIKVSASELQLR